MVFGQLHYTKRVVFMPFLVAEILNFQGSAHHVGVGSLSDLQYHRSGNFRLFAAILSRYASSQPTALHDGFLGQPLFLRYFPVPPYCAPAGMHPLAGPGIFHYRTVLPASGNHGLHRLRGLLDHKRRTMPCKFHCPALCSICCGCSGRPIFPPSRTVPIC